MIKCKINLYLSIFFSIFIFIFNNSFSIEKTEKIVVFPFENKSAEIGNYSDIAVNIVEGILIEHSKYEPINRNNLKDILEEQKLGTTGLINAEQAVEIGKIAGATKAFRGSISSISVKDNFFAEIIIELKIINVETAELIKTYVLKGEGRSLLSKESAISEAIADFGNILVAKMNQNPDPLFLSFSINLKNMNPTNGSKNNNNTFIETSPSSNEAIPSIEVEGRKGIFFSNLECSLPTDKNIYFLKLGAGISPEIVKTRKYILRTGASLDFFLSNWKYGKTLYETSIDSTSFAKGSDIYLSAYTLGISPFIKGEYIFNEQLSAIASLNYSFYLNPSISQPLIVNKNGDNKSKADIDSFNSNPIFNGWQIKFGLQYTF